MSFGNSTLELDGGGGDDDDGDDDDMVLIFLDRNGGDIGDDDDDDDALSTRRSRLRQDASSLGAEHKLCWRLQVRYSSDAGVDKILERLLGNGI